MHLYTISRFLITISLVALLGATDTEKESEQPTKLLGGIITRPEKCGYKASSTSQVKLHYRSRVWGKDEYFEDTYLKNEPLDYRLGSGGLLKGIEDGVHGMCAGEVRRLVVPADQERGIPNLVPSNSAIVVDVEMVYVTSPFSSPWFWLGGIILFGSLYTFGWPKKQADVITKNKSE